MASVLLAGCNLLSGAGDLVTSDTPGIDAPDRTPPGVGGEGGALDASDDVAVTVNDSGGSDADAGADAADAAPLRPDGGRFVFVTSTSTNGNLAGLAGGDARCTTLAAQAGLGGQWVAWLSNEMANADAIDRVVGGTPWHLVDGTRVAGSKTALAQDNLDHPIDRDETGALVQGQRVWTGTRNGMAYFGDCNGWKATTSNAPGTVGTTSSKDTPWSAEQPVGCNVTARLYCFEK